MPGSGRHSNDGEVPWVEGRDPCDAEAFRDHEDAGVGAAERHVDVGVDEDGDSFEIRARQVSRC